MKKIMQIFVLVSIIFLSSFSLAQEPISLFGGNQPNFPSIVTSSIPTEPIKESNPFYEDKLWSEKKICEFTNGCSADKCYPFGYIKNDTYCGGSEQGFVEQQHLSGDACVYDFQCSSNFCFNNECVSNYQSLIRDVLVRLYALESKLRLDLKEINTDSQVNETVTESLEIKENKVSGFFKRLFR